MQGTCAVCTAFLGLVMKPGSQMSTCMEGRYAYLPTYLPTYICTLVVFIVYPLPHPVPASYIGACQRPAALSSSDPRANEATAHHHIDIADEFRGV